MRYYPVFLDISGRPSVVVGGGKVAERKVIGLLKAGSAVTVISPRVTVGLKGLSVRKKIRHIKKGYEKGDLANAVLVVSASNSGSVNRAVYEEAAGRNIPVNVVDDPGCSSFITPSVVDRGSLVVAISTSGKSPALSRKIRLDMDKFLGKEYEIFTEILGAVRNKLLKNNVKSGKKDKVMDALVTSPLPELIREGSTVEINGLLRRLIGEGYTLKRLGIEVRKIGGRS